MVEIGIFDIQFDSRDMTLKSDGGMSSDRRCLLNFDGNVPCQVQRLTGLGSVNCGVLAPTQMQSEEQAGECSPFFFIGNVSDQATASGKRR